MRTPLVTALTVLIVFDALAWGLGVLPVLRYAMNHHELPTMAGFRALSGPFEALGLNAVVVAGIVFVAISLLKLLAAYWIWNLRMDGPVLELILLVISAIFWYGFALPIGPLFGLPQVVLIALAWRTSVRGASCSTGGGTTVTAHFGTVRPPHAAYSSLLAKHWLSSEHLPSACSWRAESSSGGTPAGRWILGSRLA